MKTKLKWINTVNGADKILLKYLAQTRADWPNDERLVGVYMGIAYGGDVEAAARVWSKRNDNYHVYGYDTFEGMHPRELSDDGNDFQAWCMDYWYSHKDWGTDDLACQYQRDTLDDMGFKDTTTLVKGLVHEDSCKDIPKIHLCFLDMDIRRSMEIGYQAVRDKIAPGGYLLLHDVIPPKHIPQLSQWCYHGQVLGTDKEMWEVEGEHTTQFTTILRKK